MLYDRVRTIREELNWTQEDVAQKLGITRSTYTKKEIGDRDFSTDELDKLADIFGVTSDFLLGKSHRKDLNALQFQQARAKDLEEMINDIRADVYTKDDGTLFSAAEKELLITTINTLRKR